MTAHPTDPADGDPPGPPPENSTPPSPVVQTQSGGINLGAYNRIEQIADIVAGDKITLVIYTGPAQPPDDAARFALEQAYRSEIAARYRLWRSQYVQLPLQPQGAAEPTPGQVAYEREELEFALLGERFQPQQANKSRDPLTTFTDLRVGIRDYRDLVVLGPPGGGKTTALWRLALDLAEAGLYGDGTTALPVVVRLGDLQPGQSLLQLLLDQLAHAALWDRERRPIPLAGHRRFTSLVPQLLEAGRLILLWDGLNEVPQTLLHQAAQQLQAFRDGYPGVFGQPNSNLVTCRADDFAALNGQESQALSWQQAVIQALDRATTEQIILRRLGQERGAVLLAQLAMPRQRGLATLVRTPLLLTMLCEVYRRNDTIPANRGRLLEAFIQTRWRWERVRQRGQWIDERVQMRGLMRLAHVMTANHGRGTSVHWEWAARMFQQAVPDRDPLQLRTLAQRADILEVLNDGQALRFSHQLLQEYFAALAINAELTYLAQPHLRLTRRWQQQKSHWQHLMQQYASPGKRTGWEETLFLLAGLQEEHGFANELIRLFLSQPLAAARLLLEQTQEIDAALTEDVRQALCGVMADLAATPQQRMEAGEALGVLGDPRFPVTTDEWRRELARRNQRFGTPEGYWCYVRPGTYRVGGWEADEPDADIEIQGFWIGRFPITVAQYTPFVQVGYGEDAERWWTPNGWWWKKGQQRAQPWLWRDQRFTMSNQPVIGVTWYEATAFCAWLTEQLAGRLPQRCVICLPTEAEWEVAAAYDAEMHRHTYPWGEAALTSERAVYGRERDGGSPAVGCCPAGMAACGALDMVGTIWECATSRYDDYPERSQSEEKDLTTGSFQVPWRGRGYSSSSAFVRRGARVRHYPGLDDVEGGFRVLLAPRLA